MIRIGTDVNPIAGLLLDLIADILKKLSAIVLGGENAYYCIEN